jgi:hypothetical protein
MSLWSRAGGAKYDGFAVDVGGTFTDLVRLDLRAGVLDSASSPASAGWLTYGDLLECDPGGTDGDRGGRDVTAPRAVGEREAA